MKDSVTGKQIVVSTDGTAGPYVSVGPDQVDALRGILDAKGHQYTTSEGVGTGSDRDTVINFGVGADAAAIQRDIDAAE